MNRLNNATGLTILRIRKPPNRDQGLDEVVAPLRRITAVWCLAATDDSYVSIRVQFS